MPKLPKSFLSRLRAQTPATLDPGSAPHPDADTLAAFAERALPAPDRASVALHLAACADCRATLELAFGVEALPAPDARPATAPVPWLGAHLWRLLLPALAAGLALVLLLPSFNRTKPVHIAAVRPLPYPKIEPGPAAVPTPTAPAAVREAARARPSSAPVAVLAKPQPLPSPASPSAALTVQPGLMASRLVPSQILAAPPPPPPALVSSLSESVQVVAAEKSIVPVQQASAPSQQDTPAAANQSGVTRLGTNVEVVAGQSQVPPAANYFEPSVEAAQDRLAQPQVTAIQSQSVASTAEVTQTASAARAQRLRAALPQSAARWEICRLSDDRQRVQGRLCQVSANGTRRAVTIDSSVELLAVASRGAEVWAGGAAGALYSSTDNGLHWRRSVVSATGTGQNQPATLTEPIVAIDLSLPEQVRIATSAGETWILQDGFWRRKTD
ncbi:MAG TPA: zf-HC2 domain-containing protein [Bryobacteraceae bacterium]|jgi:hypothetical protein